MWYVLLFVARPSLEYTETIKEALFKMTKKFRYFLASGYLL